MNKSRVHNQPSALGHEARRQHRQHQGHAGDEGVQLPVGHAQRDPRQQARRAREVHRDGHVRHERAPLGTHVFNDCRKLPKTGWYTGVLEYQNALWPINILRTLGPIYLLLS